MYGCSRVVRHEHYAALADLTTDALPQGSGVNQYKTAGPCRAFTSRPLLAKEGLTLEILVEFIAKLHLYVPE